MERLKLIDQFLQKNQLEKSSLVWLPLDASFRRYARIKKEKESFILMDSPLSESPEEFINIDRLLYKNGLSVPFIYDFEINNGLILMEDLGENTYSKVLNKKNELSLYQKALSSLIKISEIKDLQNVPLYDEALKNYRLSVFIDWFLPAILGRHLTKQEKDSYFKIWNILLKSINQAPKGLILMDFHIDNLIYLKDRSYDKSCGLLDFQDARQGFLIYDLVSLLEDARIDISKETKDIILNQYMDYFKVDKTLLNQAYHIIAVKRHLWVLGVFTRLAIRDNKSSYLKYLPRVLYLLESHLNQKCMQDFSKWLDKIFPQDKRELSSLLDMRMKK